MQDTSAPRTSEKRKSVVISAIYFAMGTLSSRVLGLVRDQVMAAYLPMDMRDIWGAAFRLPAIFRRLLGEGALAATFLPVYIGKDEATEQGEREALASGVFSLLLMVALAITVIVVIFMDQLIPLWVSGEAFTSVPGKIETTILLARWVFPFLVLMSLFAFFMTIHNARGSFFITGFAPCLFNSSIIVYLLSYSYLPVDVSVGLGLAVLFGGALQLFVLLPKIFKWKLFPDWSWTPWKNKSVIKVLKAFGPSMLGVGVLQITVLLNTYFASSLDRGTVYHVYLGDRLLELPLSLIAVSLGTALLPELSRLWAAKDTLAMKASLQTHMIQALVVAVPAAVGLFVLSTPLVSLFFERGSFVNSEVLVVSSIVQVYAVTLIVVCSHRLMVQYFFAISDTKTPALTSLAGLMVHALIAPSLMVKWGVVGLVISTTIGAMVNFYILLGVFSLRFGGLSFAIITKAKLKIFFAAGLMGLGTKYIFATTNESLSSNLSVLLAIVAAVIIYFAVLMPLRLPELQTVTGKITRRFNKK